MIGLIKIVHDTDRGDQRDVDHQQSFFGFFHISPQKCCKEVLLECNAGKIVIVLAVDAFFTEEAVLLGIH
jgi:hypothetical protein